MKKLLLGIFAATALAGSAFGDPTFVDPSFSPGAGGNGLIETVLPLPDGKVLVCGNFSTFNGVDRPNIARLNSNGSVDTSFNASPGYWVRHMTRQPDGKIIIGGFFTSVAGQSRNRIARLNADGSLDTTFNPGTGAVGTLGVSITGNPDPFVFFTAVQGDGKILITGNFTNYNGTTIYGIARLNPNGSLDTSFNVGSGLNTWGRSIQVLSNGKILVTGWFDNYHNANHDRMVLINPDGTPDETFLPIIGSSTAVYTAALLPSGKYLAAGHSENVDGKFLQEIVRLNPDGSIDNTFVGSVNDKVESLKVQSDGKIVIGGYFNVVDGQPRHNLARLNADGTLDASFLADTDNFVWTIALQGDGRILACGGFNTIDGQSRNGVARLLTTAANSGGTGGGDTTKPTVHITSPGATVTQVTSATLPLAGTAADASGIASVSISVNGGNSVGASGTTSWSGSATLVGGTNVIVVTARDTAGNSASTTRRIVYVVSSPLTITLNGSGTVMPNLNGRTLQVGRNYTISAQPAAGYVFNGWSGGATASTPVLNFQMQDAMTLQANFVPNPFLPLVGYYSGLFSNPDTKSTASAGFIVIGLNARGAFSGRLTQLGATYPFGGQFTGDKISQVTVRRPGKPPWTLNLTLGDAITGTVSGDGVSANILAMKAWSTQQVPLGARAGRYTISFPGTGAVNGNGYAVLVISPSGLTHLAGSLADGTALNQSTPLTSNGSIPIYLSVGGRNNFYGWLNVAETGDILGTFRWEKSATATTLPRDFALDLSASGGKYTAPAAGSHIITLNNPTLTLQNGDLTSALSVSFTFNGNNQPLFTTPNTNHVVMAVNPANGVFGGTFVDPTNAHAVIFRGVILQNQNIGAGYFLSSGQSGSARLTEP